MSSDGGVRSSNLGSADGSWQIRPAPPSPAGQIAAFWRYRALFWTFTKSALLDIYRTTILGLTWMFIRPLVLALAAVFVVGGVFGVSVAPLPLSLFILVGLAIWTLFRVTVQWTTKSMGRARAMLARIYAPPIVPLIAAISPAVVQFMVVFGVASLTAVYFGPLTSTYYAKIGWHSLALLPAMLLTVLMGIAVGCFTAILNVLARDTWLTLRYVLTGWMLTTPVVYPVEAVPADLRWIIELNPLTPIVVLFRWAALDYGTIEWGYLVLATVEVFILLACGIWFFARQQKRIFDYS